VTGRFDYQLRVACQDTAELDRLLRHLKRDAGVVETETRVVLRSAFTRGAS
jgi:Lrp/AsnC family transcriptional regulator, leucine-responsive regulatory protein